MLRNLRDMLSEPANRSAVVNSILSGFGSWWGYSWGHSENFSDQLKFPYAMMGFLGGILQSTIQVEGETPNQLISRIAFGGACAVGAVFVGSITPIPALIALTVATPALAKQALDTAAARRIFGVFARPAGGAPEPVDLEFMPVPPIP